MLNDNAILVEYYIRVNQCLKLQLGDFTFLTRYLYLFLSLFI